MVQRASEKAYFTFVKGLNTEASPFTFPENSSYDEENFDLLINGARRRRLGIDYESGYVATSATVTDTLQAITEHEWETAGGDSESNFTVVQTGRYIRFFSNTETVSAGLHATVLNLSTYKLSGSSQATQDLTPVAMASGKGYLFIVSKHMEPIYLTYVPSTNTITAHTFECRVREFVPIDDDVEINETPTTLSAEHRFNLINQGWDDKQIYDFFVFYGYYPSNAHNPNDGWTVNIGSGLREWKPSEITKYSRGTTPAPNGSLILNLFNTNIIYDSANSTPIASFSGVGTTTVTINTAVPHYLTTGGSVTISGNNFYYTDTFPQSVPWSLDGTYVVTVTDADSFTITVVVPPNFASMGPVTSYGAINTNTIVNPDGVIQTVRFESVGFYAGRVWFSGVSSDTLNSKIFYSQILQDEHNIGRLHQEADPTSEDDPAIVDSDGGFLTIPEIGKVVKMEVLGTYLVVCSTKGVYAVGGGAEDYFKATSFTVRHVLNVSVISPRSVVVVDGAVLAFAKQGIYSFSENPQTGTITGQSISENVIQTVFLDIPEEALKWVSGTYDDAYKRVFWTYSTTHLLPRRHTKILILDLRLQAWSKYTVPASSGVFISGCSVVDKPTTRDIKVKFFTVDTTNNKITFSDLTNTSWLDWYTFNSVGVDAPAYLLAGHELVGDVMRKKQVPYIFVYCKRSETQWISSGGLSAKLDPQSSCMVQARWDFADSTAGNKIGSAFQAYRHNRVQIAPNTLPATFDPGYSIVITKNKIRGVGKAIQLKFYTEVGKDCYIYGWATTFSGYTEV